MNSREGNSTRFPIVLHEILHMCERNGYENIFSWQPHGLSFKIRDPERFSEIVLPLYFKHNKIKSFMRQLYYYNFHRIIEGEDIDCYYHKYFERGEKLLSNKIIRKTRRGKLSKSTLTSAVAMNSTLMQNSISFDNQGMKSISYSRSLDNVNIYCEENHVPSHGQKVEILASGSSKAMQGLRCILNTEESDEVDLYAPNLSPTGIFMETPEDDLEFGLVLKILS